MKSTQKFDTPATETKKCSKIPEHTYTFTVDDNIRFFREITERNYASIFEHPYLALYKRLHGIFGVKIQLNIFYEDEKFNLSEMSDRYKSEWEGVSDWLKLSFHSRLENVRPYESSDYSEVDRDTSSVNREIVRFATEAALAKTTTVHYCHTTPEGTRALFDNGVLGLLGLFGTDASPRTSYQCDEQEAEIIRHGGTVKKDGIAFSAIDVVLNLYTREEIKKKIGDLLGRESIKIMIHEQYFYEDYKNYQPDFEDKLYDAFLLLGDSGYESVFFEELI